jgi:sugar lactone lactonase YvrE
MSNALPTSAPQSPAAIHVGTVHLDNMGAPYDRNAVVVVQPNVEVVSQLPLTNAECPVWNPVDEKLYWSDIPNGRMYRLEPSGPKLIHEAGQQLGAMVVGEDGSIIQGLETGRVQRWHDGEVTMICEGIPAERVRRFNDGTVDPFGRVLFGTMDDEGAASVYHFEADGRHRLVMGEIGEANGMAFSDDGKTLYVTDTKRHLIWACLYLEGGVVSGCHTFVEVPSAKPDGLTIDTDGNLWSAHWGGGCVVCYSCSGAKLARIDMPVSNVSSVTFGNRDLRTLFITTAGGDDRERNGPLAGAVFATQIPGVQGREPHLAKVKI